MRPSRLINRFVRWVPRKDGGLEPAGPYDLWVKVSDVEGRLQWWWRWSVTAPVRKRLGLRHSYYNEKRGWVA